MNTIRLDKSICTDLAKARTLEWLETNGLGGYASSTVAGLNTRRYHGLLMAATKPPAGRMLLLANLEETLVLDGHRHDLSVNQYPGTIHPEGYRLLQAFRLDPFPTFLYRVNGVEIEKRIFMVHGENTTVVQYEVRGTDCEEPRACSLEVRPLVAFRDFHSTTHQNDALNPLVDASPGLAVLVPYAGLPALYLAHDAAGMEATGHWYYNFEYEIERERGLDYQEDLFNPLALRFEFGARSFATLIASTTPRSAADANGLREAEVERRAAIVGAAPSREPIVETLTVAADQYVVDRGDLKTVIAGYPWFGDWGRDTMIALPGLTLVTGRYEIARNILEAFAASVDRGMLPNRFPDHGEAPEYNTVDATLWFFEAARAYLHHTGDYGFVRSRLYAKLHEIVDYHLRGTRYGIHADSDGLLACGEPGVQLTWMDAKIGDWVVTPRTGKPVEIQALWYNALRVLEDLSARFGDKDAELSLRSWAAKARESFNTQFWNAGAGCLYDVVNGNERDGSIRPNQIIALSLANRMLDAGRERQVLEVVTRDLLTPLGLRSLAPGDRNYRARYEGGPYERDSGYHQGAVWPWLMGPFLTAYMRVNGGSPAARAQARQWLANFANHLSDAGLGHISEIADGAAPHAPRGCFAQAWSVAEILRAAVEDVYVEEQKPSKEKARMAPVSA